MGPLLAGGMGKGLGALGAGGSEEGLGPLRGGKGLGPLGLRRGWDHRVWGVGVSRTPGCCKEAGEFLGPPGAGGGVLRDWNPWGRECWHPWVLWQGCGSFGGSIIKFHGTPPPGSLRLPNCPCPSLSWGSARLSSMVRFGGWGELEEGWGDEGSLGHWNYELNVSAYEWAQHTPARGLGGSGCGVGRDIIGSHPGVGGTGVLLIPPCIPPSHGGAGWG